MNGSHKFYGKVYAHRCKLLCDFAHVCTCFKSLQERFKARCYVSRGFLEKTNIGVRSKNTINLLEGMNATTGLHLSLWLVASRNYIERPHKFHSNKFIRIKCDGIYGVFRLHTFPEGTVLNVFNVKRKSYKRKFTCVSLKISHGNCIA